MLNSSLTFSRIAWRAHPTLSEHDLFDSVTTFKGKGFYRVDVLYRQVLVAEYFVVKGFPKESHWSILASECDFRSDHHFKTLAEAKRFCIEQSI